MDRCVICHVALFRNLGKQAESDGAVCHALRQLFVKVVGIPLLQSGLIDILLTRIGYDAVPEVSSFAVGIDELKSVHSVIRFRRKTYRRRLRSLYKSEGLGMRAEELFRWGWRLRAWRRC